MSYIIGSFNVQKFKNGKDLDKIAEIILSEKIDVVGIQEVFSEMAVRLLVDSLKRRSVGQVWNYSVSTRPGGDKGEYYAYIWNERRLSLVSIPNKENPVVVERFSIKNVPRQKRLVRNPYFARFTAANHRGGSNFEIRLVNTHIRFGKGAKDAACIANEKQMRINEFNLLIQDILPYCGDIRSGNFMPAYTFLLGDYNLCLEDGKFGAYKISEITYGRPKLSGTKSYRTVQKLPTSLKRPTEDTTLSDDEEENEAENMTESDDFYSQNYDHFSYDLDLDNKLTICPDRVEAVDLAYADIEDKQERLSNYRKKISDHVPVKITVDFSRRAR